MSHRVGVVIAVLAMLGLAVLALWMLLTLAEPRPSPRFGAVASTLTAVVGVGALIAVWAATGAPAPASNALAVAPSVRSGTPSAGSPVAVLPAR